MKYLTPLDDTAAEAGYVTATEKGDRHSEPLVLLRNLQHQINELEARVVTLETP